MTTPSFVRRTVVDVALLGALLGVTPTAKAWTYPFLVVGAATTTYMTACQTATFFGAGKLGGWLARVLN